MIIRTNHCLLLDDIICRTVHVGKTSLHPRYWVVYFVFMDKIDQIDNPVPRVQESLYLKEDLYKVVPGPPFSGDPLFVGSVVPCQQEG